VRTDLAISWGALHWLAIGNGLRNSFRTRLLYEVPARGAVIDRRHHFALRASYPSSKLCEFDGCDHERPGSCS
jgi:hypothetical protein